MEDFKLLHKTFIKFLKENARLKPDEEFAFFADDNLRVTKKEVYVDSISVARGLLAQGIRKGDKVAILSENSYEMILIFLACAHIGAISPLLNARLNVGELYYILKNSEPKMIAFAKGSKGSLYADIISDVLNKDDELKHSILSDNLVYIGEEGLNDNRYTLLNDLKNKGKSISDKYFEEVCANVGENDNVLLMYTSGTTGNAKGVLVSQYSLINNANIVSGNLVEVSEEDRICSSLPLYHIFSLVLVLCSSIIFGFSFTILRNFSAKKQLEVMKNEKSTVLYAVPSMLIAFLANNKSIDFKINKIAIGGAYCHKKTILNTLSTFKAETFLYGYGLTETTSAIAVNKLTPDSNEDDFKTVGPAIDRTEIKIVSHETGEDLDIGEQGDILCRGFCVTQSYYKDDDNPNFTQNGWFNTGDIGKLDKYGRLFITGRSKDVINKGSECILAKEIEEVIMQEDGIKDVQVVGVKDKFFGEEIAAYVIRNNFNIDADMIKDIVGKRLSLQKIPKYVIFKNEFPMTATGKVKKYMLDKIDIV